MMHVTIVRTLRKIGTIFSFVGGSLKPAETKTVFQKRAKMLLSVSS